MGVTAENKKGEEINADEAALAEGYGNIFAGYQGSLVGRSIIRKTHVDNIEHAVEELIHEREHHQGLNAETLYPYDEYRKDKYEVGHHWGLHVDLNACTGCGACTIACMAENNIPVVGKKQVARHQEMAWLRIDRYYYGDVTNPNVVYQPMMCQHCDNAPCENVCPVNATNHSSEGLNQMTYNRCIGTRYCANNCPYKVRRFNWLDYTTADLFPANQVDVNEESVPFGADNLTRMVLNPDVTVRSRGVIEKCSFCVQKIQEGKLTAKVEGRQLRDGDIKSACQMACPTGALTFGDTNMKEGDFHDKLESPLNMIVLEEINVRSSVTYTNRASSRCCVVNHIWYISSIGWCYGILYRMDRMARYRYLGSEQNYRLGLGYYQLRMVDRYRSRRYADISDLTTLQTEVAYWCKQSSRGHDYICRDVCGTLSADTHGTDLVSHLHIPLS
jgi:molybdopterin-containing oxidoreductase family iron-sulfur binding subunit